MKYSPLTKIAASALPLEIWARPFQAGFRRGLRQLGRFWKQQNRRIISSILVVTFTVTMTGLDKLVYAFDNDRQDRNEDSLHAPSNPLADAAANQFVDSYSPVQTETQTGPQLTDTSLNVLKAEYGDLLDTTSLQTVAERAASGMSLDSAVNLMVAEEQPTTGSVLPANVELPEGQTGAPADNPTAMADAVTLGQGPLALSLNLGQDTTVSVPVEEDLAELPSVVPAAEGNDLPPVPGETAVTAEVPTAGSVDTKTTATDVPATTPDETVLAANVTAPETNGQQDTTTVPDQTNSNRPEVAGAPQQDENQANQPVANIPNRPEDGDITIPNQDDTDTPEGETDAQSLKDELAALLGDEEEDLEGETVDVASLTRPEEGGETLELPVTDQPVVDDGESGRVDPAALLPDGGTLPDTPETGEAEPTDASPVLTDMIPDQPEVGVDPETNKPEGEIEVVADEETPIQNTGDVDPTATGPAMVGPETTERPEIDVPTTPTTHPEVTAATVTAPPTGQYVQVQPELRTIPTTMVASTNVVIPPAPTAQSSTPNVAQLLTQGIQVIAGTTPAGTPTNLQAYKTVPVYSYQPTSPQLGYASPLALYGVMGAGMQNYQYQWVQTGTTQQMSVTGQMPKPPTIVDVVKQVQAATANQSTANIPPIPTGATTPNIQPWTGERSASFPPTDYSGMYAHPDPPENAGKEPSKCAKFMGSFFGRLIMFVVAVVLTVVTVGTAAPVILAIMIVLLAIQFFAQDLGIQLSPTARIILSVITAAFGGWASALNSIYQGATVAFTVAVKELANAVVIQSIVKAALTDLMVQLFILNFPNAPIWMTAAVSLCAGILAGGIAQGFANVAEGKSFFSGFMQGLKDSFKEAFGLKKPASNVTYPLSFARVIASPAMITIISTAVELVVMEALGGNSDRLIWGSIAGAAVSGALALSGKMYLGFSGKVGNYDNKAIFNDVMRTFVKPVISSAVSSWFMVNVQPVIHNQAAANPSARTSADMFARMMGNQAAQFVSNLVPEFGGKGQLTVGLGVMWEGTQGPRSGTHVGNSPNGNSTSETGQQSSANNRFNENAGVTAGNTATGDNPVKVTVNQDGKVQLPSESASQTGKTGTTSAVESTGQQRTDSMQQQQRQQQDPSTAQSNPNTGGTKNVEAPKSQSPKPETKTTETKNPNTNTTNPNTEVPNTNPNKTQQDLNNLPNQQQENVQKSAQSESNGVRQTASDSGETVRDTPDVKPVKDAPEVKAIGNKESATDGTGQRRDGDVPKAGGKGGEGDGSNSNNGGNNNNNNNNNDNQGNQPMNVADAISGVKKMNQDGKMPSGFTPKSEGKTSSDLRDVAGRSDVLAMASKLGIDPRSLQSGQYQLVEGLNANGNSVMQITTAPNANGDYNILAASMKTGGGDAVTLAMQPGTNQAQAYINNEKIATGEVKVAPQNMQGNVKDTDAGLDRSQTTPAKDNANRNLSSTENADVQTSPDSRQQQDPRLRNQNGSNTTAQTELRTGGTDNQGQGQTTGQGTELKYGTQVPQTIKTPDGQDVTVSGRYYPNEPVIYGKDSQGNTYMARLNPDGTVAQAFKQVSIGNLWSAQPAFQEITNGKFAETFQEMPEPGTGNVTGVYKSDGKGGYTLVSKPYYASVNGVNLKAILPVTDMANLNGQQREAAVLAANSNLSTLANNPSVINHLKGQGITPDNPVKFEAALQEMAHNLAGQAVTKAEQGLARANTEAEVQAGFNTLAAAKGAYVTTMDSQSPKYQDAVKDFVNSAHRSTDLGTQLQAAGFQVRTGDNRGAVETITNAYSKLPETMAGPERLNAALQTVQALQNSGAPGMKAANDFMPTLEQLAKGVPMTTVQAAQLDGVRGDKPAGFLSQATDQTMASVLPQVLKDANATQITIPGTGTVEKQPDGTYVLKQTVGDSQVTTAFTVNAENKTAAVNKVIVSDATGPKQVFEMSQNNLMLGNQRVEVQLVIDGRTVTRNMMVTMPPTHNTVTGIVKDANGIYTVALDLNTRQTTVLEFKPENNAFKAGAQETLNFENGVPRSLSGKPVFTFESAKSAEVAEAFMKGNPGLNFDQAMKLVNALGVEGKTVYVVGGTLFLGTQAQITAGQYFSAGVANFGEHGSQMYITEYKDGALANSHISDGRIIEFKNGSDKNFSVTWRSADGWTYVALYKDGQMANVTREFRQIPGAGKIVYDKNDVITADSLKALQSGSGKQGYTLKMLPNGGFTLSANGVEIAFTADGQPMSPKANDAGAPSTDNVRTGTSETMRFMVSETFVFAAYNNSKGHEVTVNGTEKGTLMGQVSPEGGICKTVMYTNVVTGATRQTAEYVSNFESVNATTGLRTVHMAGEVVVSDQQGMRIVKGYETATYERDYTSHDKTTGIMVEHKAGEMITSDAKGSRITAGSETTTFTRDYNTFDKNTGVLVEHKAGEMVYSDAKGTKIVAGEETTTFSKEHVSFDAETGVKVTHAAGETVVSTPKGSQITFGGETTVFTKAYTSFDAETGIKVEHQAGETVVSDTKGSRITAGGETTTFTKEYTSYDAETGVRVVHKEGEVVVSDTKGSRITAGGETTTFEKAYTTLDKESGVQVTHTAGETVVSDANGSRIAVGSETTVFTKP